MRLFSIVLAVCLISFFTAGQTAKPKPKTQPGKTKTSAAPSKKSVSAKPKPSATPSKKSASAKTKPSATPSKKTTSAKPKPSATPSKKPISAKPKPIAAKTPDETAAWTKAISIEGREQRIDALIAFKDAYPKSTKRDEALTQVAFLRVDAGNERLAAGETDAAAAIFSAAAKDSPKPVPDQLWNEALSKIAANLYFRGSRDTAIEIEQVLEGKAENNLPQLLSIAGFYITIENGAEAKRLAEKVIAAEPTSVAAYQTLGLANRIDFELFGAASAYTRALELDPKSTDAKRGLAEMKRALGKPDDAVALYREILSADSGNIPVETGLILSLFDAGKRSEAETEMSRSLEANPGNIMLLAGAAYWYAANGDGLKAVEFAQKALDTDPRFIWSHIALARGFLLQNRPADAEKILLAARRYGNFPTLEYELASARLAAGYYREAAEGLSNVFKIKEGVLSTRLGGRVSREAKTFTELVAAERQASILAPMAADNLVDAARLAALLEFKQQLDLAVPNPDSSAAAADAFVSGSDNMRVYRQIFAASQLLEKKTALPKVIELTRSATSGLEAGLDLPNASIAVMASELYANRAAAALKGEYIVVPKVPRQTLSAVMRGRLEEVAGWAHYGLGSADDAIVRLRRAVAVLPVDSAWWRSSTWRLGAAYALAGKETEALDMYIRSYKSAGPDLIRYGIIEALYRRLNGNTDGLADKVGPNPVPSIPVEVIAQKTEASPTPVPEPSPAPTPRAETSSPAGPGPSPTPEQKIEATPTPEPSPTAEAPKATPAPQPGQVPENPPAQPVAEPTPSPTPAVTEPAPQPTPTPEASGQTLPTTQPQTESKTRELFPPVIITIPSPEKISPTIQEPKPDPSPTVAPSPTQTPLPEKPAESVVAEDVRPRVVAEPTPSPEIKPCKITVSEETMNLKHSGGKLAVIVGLDDDGDVDAVQATSSSPQDVTVTREPIAGLTTRALFVLLSVSDRIGVYQVTFELPCGKRTVVTNVR